MIAQLIVAVIALCTVTLLLAVAVDAHRAGMRRVRRAVDVAQQQPLYPVSNVRAGRSFERSVSPDGER